jgi:CDP-diacylglycerol pyrophosphatase
MAKISIFALIVFAIVGLIFTTALARDSLWLVVETCGVNFNLTGAPFPCLEVSPSSAGHPGYVVLRPPLGEPDTILSPTRRVRGLEDPALTGPDAASYFEEAWRSRNLLPGSGEQAPARDGVVLAINSASARTQDQLHIHIGCATPAVRKWVNEASPALSASQWARIGERFRGRTFWGRRVARDDLDGFDPFDLVNALLAAHVTDPRHLFMAVVAIRAVGEHYHFTLIAGNSDQAGRRDETDVKILMDPSCAA